jgi:uncharacterized damage-inducible protein DinB
MSRRIDRRHFARTSLAATAAAFAFPGQSGIARIQKAGGAQKPTIAAVLDFQLSAVEKDLVAAAEAMPADKYSFAPPGRTFVGVRTFAQQVKHVAVYNNRSFMAILGEMVPKDGENGKDSMRTKQQIVKYLRDSYALGHKAITGIEADNLLSEVKNSPEEGYDSPLALVTFVCWHAFDHYGQMVEYLRMNEIVPPASLNQPPANPAKPR